MQGYESGLAQAQYEQLDELGSGSFGSVHIGRRSSDGGQVAIKVIKHSKPGFYDQTVHQLLDLRKIKREILIMRSVCFSPSLVAHERLLTESSTPHPMFVVVVVSAASLQ